MERLASTLQACHTCRIELQVSLLSQVYLIALLIPVRRVLYDHRLHSFAGRSCRGALRRACRSTRYPQLPEFKLAWFTSSGRQLSDQVRCLITAAPAC